MSELFSNEIVNRGRQKELDIAKTISIVLMIACHVIIYFCDISSTMYWVGDCMGSEFGAPVFMVCMGVGIAYSKNSNPFTLFKRGLKILFLGYVLNFFRAGIIVLIGNAINIPFSIGKPFFESMMLVDIMQFAGLALMVFALFKKLNLSPAVQFMIGILAAGLGEILAWKSFGNITLDYIFALIWGTCENSYFPLLNWLAFPAAGVFFGDLLLHCKDKNALYKKIFAVGLVGVVLAYYQIYFTEGYYNTGSYYLMGIKNVIFALCYPITMFSITQLVAEKTPLGDWPIFAFCSRRLNTIYCVSWVLILVARYVIYDIVKVSLSDLGINAVIVAVGIATYFIAKGYEKWLNRKKK